jgi:alpha-glucosidase
MTDWTPRDIEISFDFIDEGSYKATICKDGINADRYASDYVIEHLSINKSDKIKLHLAPGGGFFIKLEKNR